MYLGFVYKFGGKKIAELVQWQVDDMIAAIYNQKIDYRIRTLEVLWNRSRRSGKTMCAAILAVFYVILGYRVRWFTPGTGQMKAARMWFMQNPFFIKLKKVEREIHITGQEHIFIWNVLASHVQVTGDECDCLFYDEGGDVEIGKVVYSNYEDSRPFVINSDFAHMLHFSTPARYTAFAEAKDDLEIKETALKTKFIFIRDWTWCPWTKKERIMDEAARHPEDPYFIQKNYECLWVVYGGAVFANTDFYDISQVSPELREAWYKMEPTHGGVDWNGEQTQHFLQLIAVTDKYVFVKDEIKFWGYNTLFDWHDKVSLELESDDPFSNQYADEAAELGVNGIYEGWDDSIKMERIRQLKKRTIILDKSKSPILFKNLKEAAYDKKKRLPSLAKRTDQHGLDSLMHAIHIYNSQMYAFGVTGKRKKKVNIIESGFSGKGSSFLY